jgi:hypothetical protein
MLRFATSNIQPFRKLLKYVRALGKDVRKKYLYGEMFWEQKCWAVSQEVHRIYGIRKVLYSFTDVKYSESNSSSSQVNKVFLEDSF